MMLTYGTIGRANATAFTRLAENDHGSGEGGDGDTVRASVGAEPARDVVELGALDVSELGGTTVVVDSDLKGLLQRVRTHE